MRRKVFSKSTAGALGLALAVLFCLPGKAAAQDGLQAPSVATGTMVAAALESVGYEAQSQVLTELSDMLETLGGLVYLLVVLTAVLSVAVSGGFRMALWILIGPPLFVYLSGIEVNGVNNRTQAAGVEWAFGAFRDTDGLKDQMLQPVGGVQPSDVSFFFHKYNEFVSEAVQKIVSVLTNDELDAQMLFMARQRTMEDLFGFDNIDPNWQALVSYFMVQCATELNYAALVSLGGIDPSFADEPEYETAKREYCRLWPKQTKPFQGGPWFRYVYDKKFWEHPNIERGLHYAKLQEGTGKVSCAEMWSWVIAGGVEAVEEKANGALEKNLNPYALRLGTGVEVLQDIQEKNTNAEGPPKREPLPDPCPEASSVNGQAIVTPLQGSNSPGASTIGGLLMIISHGMLRKHLVRGPAEELALRAGGDAGIRKSPATIGRVQTTPYGKTSIVRRMKAHELSTARKYEAFSLIMLMPHLQGIILYALAVTFPFFAMLVLMPGQAGNFFSWMALWAWAKMWDVGWALVMIADRILWELFPKSAFFNRANPEAYASPISLMEGAFVGDHSYNQATYWLLLGTMMMAVPIVTGHAVLGTKKVIGDTLANGFKDIANRYGGESTGSGGMQSFIAMDNTGDAIIAEERQRVGGFYKKFMSAYAGVAGEGSKQQAIDEKLGQGVAGAATNTAVESARTFQRALQDFGNASNKSRFVVDNMLRAGNPKMNASELSPGTISQLSRSTGAYRDLVVNEEATGATIASTMAVQAGSSDPNEKINNLQQFLLRMAGMHSPHMDKTARENQALMLDALITRLTDNPKHQGKAPSVYDPAIEQRMSKLEQEILRTQVQGYGFKSAGDLVGLFSQLSGDSSTTVYDFGADLRKGGIYLQKQRYLKTADVLEQRARFYYYQSYFDHMNRGDKAAASMRGQWFFYPAPPSDVGALLDASTLHLQGEVERVQRQIEGAGARRAGEETLKQGKD